MQVQGTNAIAFEAAAALDAYEEQLGLLRRPGPGHGRIALMQMQLRRIWGFCLSLPQLSTASVALLLAHHRLLADLAASEASPAGHRARFDTVEHCVHMLQRQCRELFLAAHLH